MDTNMIPVDAEDVVLGAVILDSTAMSRAMKFLRHEHFGQQTHRIVYEVLTKMWRDGTPIDIVTLSHEMRTSASLPTLGGWGPACAMMLGWSNRVASSKHIDKHCAIVREHYSRRVLNNTGMRLLNSTSQGIQDADEILSGITKDIQQASSGDLSVDVNAGERAYAMMNNPERPKPIYLGMGPLDQMVFILDGNIVTISAPAGVGKTAFVLSAVLNLMPQRKPWFVSLEMPADELIQRALCQMCFVDIDRALEGRLTEDEKARMAEAANKYSDILGLMDIDDSGSMSIGTFQAKAEHKVNNEGINLIVIDYVQLMSGSGERNKADEYEAISKGIRSTARKLKVPILEIIHVNREGLAHGSTQFEKDAHVMLMLKREQGHPIMGIEARKNRNGRTGTIDIPVAMQYGLVGRDGPPHWVNSAAKPFTPPNIQTDMDLDQPF
jgi:replicative DNA helicase